MPTLEENPYRIDRHIVDAEVIGEVLPAPVMIAHAVEALIRVSHSVSVAGGWHHDLVTGKIIEHNVAERLMLIVSEISEAMEAHRKGLMDDKLPNRLGIEVELADALHRIFDLAGKHGMDLGGAFVEKAAYNLTRPDHKPENRRKEGGKSY